MPDSVLSPPVQRFLVALRSRWRALAAFVLAVAVLAAVVSLLLPSWFRARATLLPPTEGSDSYGIMAQLAQTSTLSRLGLFSTQSPSDVFAEILRSRTLHEELIQGFDLQSRYHVKNMDVALKQLDTHLRVDVDKSGLIVVEIEDRDPRRAADMANFLVDRLDRFNRETYNTRAKRVRIFLEDRLSDVSARLAQAESTLTVYEQRNKVLTGSESAAVQGVADVMAQRLSLQIKRAYVSSYTRGDDPALREIDAQMAAYERELGKMPALKQEGQRLALDAELQRRLFSLITAQYEDARVQETRDTPTVTVLDRARAPVLRNRPRRSLIVIAATALALALGSAWIALRSREPSSA